ncbi:MAG: RidA family protein [Phycisphaerales bacterium]
MVQSDRADEDDELNPMVTPITTDAAPLPLGHYSQGVVHNGMLHVATQLPIVPGGAPDPGAPAGVQAERALQNVLAIVEAAGGSAATLLRVTIYLADIAAWDEANAAYARVMGPARPARGVIQVAGLHHGFKVAMDAVAAVPGLRQRDGTQPR